MTFLGLFPTNRAAPALFPHRGRWPPIPVPSSPPTKKGVERCCQFPKATSHSATHWERSQDSAHSHTHTCNDDSEITPNSISKGQSPGGRLGEPQSSPGEVTQDRLNSPSNELCDDTCEMLPPGKLRLIKPQHPGSFLGLVTQAPSARTEQNPRLQGGKRGFP